MFFVGSSTIGPIYVWSMNCQSNFSKPYLWKATSGIVYVMDLGQNAGHCHYHTFPDLIYAQNYAFFQCCMLMFLTKLSIHGNIVLNQVAFPFSFALQFECRGIAFKFVPFDI